MGNLIHSPLVFITGFLLTVMLLYESIFFIARNVYSMELQGVRVEATQDIQTRGYINEDSIRGIIANRCKCDSYEIKNTSPASTGSITQYPTHYKEPLSLRITSSDKILGKTLKTSVNVSAFCGYYEGSTYDIRSEMPFGMGTGGHDYGPADTYGGAVSGFGGGEK